MNRLYLFEFMMGTQQYQKLEMKITGVQKYKQKYIGASISRKQKTKNCQCLLGGQ